LSEEKPNEQGTHADAAMMEAVLVVAFMRLIFLY